MKRALIASLYPIIFLSHHSPLAQPSIASTDAGRPRNATTAAQHAAPDLAEFDKQVARIVEIIRKMQQLLETVERTRDTQERLRLLQEHWNTLQDAMNSLRELWSPGLMGCCGSVPLAEERIGARTLGGPMMGGTMNWRGAGGYYTSLSMDQLKQRQYMTDQYLAMQLQVMTHMMLHQHWIYQIQTQSPARAR
jgi:hypothetical protein